MAKVEFSTLFKHGETAVSPSGTDFDKKYRMKIDSRGHKVLVLDGETNRYVLIQSHADECNIELLIKRANGDLSQLVFRNGLYGDFTQMPKDLAEAQNMILDLKESFKNLPVDVRKKFDFSFEAFVMQAGKKEWLEKLGITKNEVEKPVEKVAEKAAEKPVEKVVEMKGEE